jgi:hypothetical protein
MLFGFGAGAVLGLWHEIALGPGTTEWPAFHLVVYPNRILWACAGAVLGAAAGAAAARRRESGRAAAVWPLADPPSAPEAALAAAEEDDRPWERPGALRRDCLPHRGEALRALALVGLVCSVLSLGLWAPGLLGLVLGTAAWALAHRDLARMRGRLMDPAGRSLTELALDRGMRAALLGLFTLLVWGAVLAVVLWRGLPSC